MGIIISKMKIHVFFVSNLRTEFFFLMEQDMILILPVCDKKETMKVFL